MATRIKNRKMDKKRSNIQSKILVRTAILFCLLAVTGNVISYFLTKGEHLYFFEVLTAHVAGFLMKITGLEPVIYQNIIKFAGTVWLVDTECTAVNLINVFAAFICVYPASIKNKSIGLLLGLPFIIVANIARLLGMAWVVEVAPSYLGYFHDYLWQVLFLIMVGLMWLFWVDKLVSNESKEPISA